MAMISVDYSEQLRAAFNAGRSAGAAPFIAAKMGEQGVNYLASVPTTYEAWLESRRNRPQRSFG